MLISCAGSYEYRQAVGHKDCFILMNILGSIESTRGLILMVKLSIASGDQNMVGTVPRSNIMMKSFDE